MPLNRAFSAATKNIQPLGRCPTLRMMSREGFRCAREAVPGACAVSALKLPPIALLFRVQVAVAVRIS